MLLVQQITKLLEVDNSYFTFDSVRIPVKDVLAPGQKWRNNDTNTQVVIKIDNVNTVNSTFSATYGIIRGTTISEFPLRGEFDPDGITIGWVVSYWNKHENDHALGAWSGYASLDMVTHEPRLSTTRIIVHEDNYNTTTGYDIFDLQVDN